MKLPQLNSKHDTNLAISLTFVGAAIPWLGSWIHSRMQWNTQLSGAGLIRDLVPDAGRCGITPKEAHAKGCRFESFSATWQLPECYDEELDKEFRSLQPWKFFKDQNGTIEISLAEVEKGSAQVWTTWGFHLWQCAFHWKKEVKIAHGLVSGSITPHQCLDHSLMQDHRHPQDYVGVPYWPRFQPCQPPSDISVHQFELKPAGFVGSDKGGKVHDSVHEHGSHNGNAEDVHKSHGNNKPDMARNDDPVIYDSESSKAKVTLTGTQETLLGTISAKAADALSPNSMLRDKWAAELLTKLDYNFSRLGVSGWLQAWPVMRSRSLDRWTSEFLDQHMHSPVGATVLHLACGLDSRALRLQKYFNRLNIRWVDVDLPDVVELRRQVVEEPAIELQSLSSYSLITASVTSPGWLEKIPADRPTIVVFEGLSMYLSEEEAHDMIRRLVSHFKQGQLIFDVVNSFFVGSQRWVSPVAKSGSTLKWYVDRPIALEAWAEGLHLRDEVFLSRRAEIKEFPWLIRWQFWVAASLPRVHEFSRELRFSF
ncbi:O-methyltransferase [Paramyrothecium foliicola]|nr:O-methyltransferase [Paramyrothecium foliicola]